VTTGPVEAVSAGKSRTGRATRRDRFTFTTNSNGNNSTPRMAYPALRATKEDDNVDFQLSSATTLHIRSSRSTRARNLLVALGALGAECLSTPRIAFANKMQEGNIKCLSSTRIRNVRRTSKHFRRLKLTF